MNDEVKVKQLSVIVVGAGIVGASIAYHLARQGAQVTVVEQATPGSGVTGHSFAWINPLGDFPVAARALRSQALVDYQRLQQELPGLKINWSGALCYTDAVLDSKHANDRGTDPSVNWIDRQQIGQLEPHLQVLPERARYAPGEGSLDPIATTQTLLEGARAHGARVLTQNPVLGLQVDGKRLVGVETALGSYQADCMVLAAGCGTPSLLQPLGIKLPVSASPSILIRFDAPPGLVKTLISNNQLEIRATADGGLLVAEDYIDASGPQGPDAIAQQAMATLRQSFRGAEGIVLRSVEVGQRPMPQDQLPIIGLSDQYQGLYLAVMHAGVTLAATVGRLISQELVQDQPCAELSPCRPARFNSDHRPL
ncbi:FAD-dependent oxidoreductase [Pseudomonas sp. Fl5BN2]|uniref:NAD(P)/FAD-dependent oxidoreductase n=1 Tax=Pseudomonas sp. Fl5BN2 TaxID=2697652 RepID=UPI0013772BE6|nr:FAD-binding oxidoreductase [Pseudomonas sp. Fl5BN2]NBF04540.1 FAD-dependent oxidoreductase [Pseudomonas sp. Fl5BN2]